MGTAVNFLLYIALEPPDCCHLDLTFPVVICLLQRNFDPVQRGKIFVRGMPVQAGSTQADQDKACPADPNLPPYEI